MKTSSLLLSMILCCVGHTPLLLAETSFNKDSSSSSNYILNNRILAKINNKAISMLDIIKKMDIVFYREISLEQQTTQARQQFYLNNWRYFLSNVIEEELIVADATEKKMTVSDALVREEIERAFGPDIHQKIADLGFTYQEIWDLLYQELTMEKMMGIYNFKADMVTSAPKYLLTSYQQRLQQYQQNGFWIYRVISFRGQDSLKAEQRAQEIYQQLANDRITIEKISALQHVDQDEPTIISLSESLQQTTKEMAIEVQNTLANLQVGQYSRPIAQVSRLNKREMVYRIYYLEQHQADTTRDFASIEQQLKNSTQLEQFNKEKGLYLQKLRNYFAVEEFTNAINDRFEPFLRY